MTGKSLAAMLGLALTSTLPAAAGYALLSATPSLVSVPRPAPVTAIVPAPLRYGNFGGPGNPYRDDTGSVAGLSMSAPVNAHPAGSNDAAVWPSGDYNPSDLNGGSRGFPTAGLTVNQTLPSSSQVAPAG
jgi:hypothetical protein